MPDPRERDELDELLRQVSRLRTRYGATEGTQQQLRLEGAMRRRQRRVGQIRREIEQLSTEAATLNSELIGVRTGLIAFLSDVVHRLRTEHGEGWSPTPVVGYRMWALGNGRMHGARHVWAKRTLSATCTDADPDDPEVPHTDGRCGRLGCGIYAAKDLDPLLESLAPGSGHDYVVGRVELTGKVVEHDAGYRAERAEAVAVVVIASTGVLASRDPRELDRLFADPDATLQDSRLDSFWTRHMTIDYLTDWEDPWTSEDSAA